MASSVVWRNFNKVDQVVNESTRHLDDCEKKRKIDSAVDRLRALIEAKHGYEPGDPIRPLVRRDLAPTFNNEEIRPLDLSTFSAMLDAKPSVWEKASETTYEGDFELNGQAADFYPRISLRKALDVSRYNPFNLLGGQFGPLWGTTDTLDKVERALGIVQKTKRVAAFSLPCCENVRREDVEMDSKEE